MTALIVAPSIVGLVACLIVSWALWRRRPGPAWSYAALTGVAVALWCAGQAGWWLIGDEATRDLVARVQYAGIALSPVLWLLTGLAYAGQREWLRRGRIAALMTIPALTILAVATNDLHGLVWAHVAPVAGRANTDVYFGAWFYVHLIYSYIAGAIGSLILAARFAASPLYRRQLGVVMIGGGLVLVANLLYLSSRGQFAVDPTPTAFALAFTAVGWAMARHHFFRLLPIARGVTIEGLGDGVIILNADGCVVDSNPAARALLGAPGAPLGTTLARLFPSLGTGGSETPRELTLGAARLEARLTPVRGDTGELEGTVVLLRDVTAERIARESLERAQEDLRLANDELARLASTDALTGLANRRRLDEGMEEEFARARRHERPLSFIMMDIDRFKVVNDRHGHAAGDGVLASCGRAIADDLRPGDLAARLGGDEFGILLPDATETQAHEVAVRLHRAMASLTHEVGAGPAAKVTVSLGVATLRADDRTPAHMRARADRALYAVKHSGRNGIRAEDDAHGIAATEPGLIAQD